MSRIQDSTTVIQFKSIDNLLEMNRKEFGQFQEYFNKRKDNLIINFSLEYDLKLLEIS